MLLANLGVLAATLITGHALHWEIGIPLVTALLFGAIISATDPISVLAIFKELAVAKRLAVIVEAASLFNDGTAVVLFQILLAGILTGNLSIAKGLGTIGPLIRWLRLSTTDTQDEFAVARVGQIAASARQAELEELFRPRVISGPVYGKLRQELDSRIAALQAQVAEMYGRDSSRAQAEMQTARLRLAAAEKSAIEAAVRAEQLQIAIRCDRFGTHHHTSRSQVAR